jgi:putative tricarboxylic transport membrane protein
LGIAAYGSFIAGTLGLVGLMFFATPLATFALKFGPPEYVGLLALGLTFVIFLASGSKIKAIIMGAFGFILSCVGIDTFHGAARLSFNVMRLWDGIDIVAVAMGLFGISEVLINMEKAVSRDIIKSKIENLFPTRLDWIRSKGAILRGTLLGFFVGILPGGHPAVAAFLSYGLEKRISKEPEKFGKGAIEGVAGPEAANNSATAGSFIPLLILGIPTNVVVALLFGALMIHGIRPGPFLLKEHPEAFWGVVSSMYLGNVMLLVLNLPLIPMWVQVLKVPDRILFPLITLFCIIGTYSVNNSIFDVGVMIMFGAFGYICRKFEYEMAPLILAFVLGPMFETNLRQSLMLSQGSFLIFFTRPICAVFIGIATLLLILPFFLNLKKVSEIEDEL